MQIGRPQFREIFRGIVHVVADARDIIRQRVHPHVHHVPFIEVHGNPPLERRARYAQILQAFFQEVVHHLVLAGSGADEIGVRFDVFRQSVGIFAHFKEVRFFLFALYFSAAIGALAVYQLAFREKRFARRAVPALIAALINIALLVKFTENFRHYFFVLLVRSADKFVIAHAHAVPDTADFGGNLVHVPLRRNARGGGFFLYLLPVLVRARLQKHFITLFAFEPGDRVRQNRLVRVADMRLARSVGDCRRHIKFAFVFSGVSFFCHNLLRAPSGRCRNGSTLFIIPRFP